MIASEKIALLNIFDILFNVDLFNSDLIGNIN